MTRPLEHPLVHDADSDTDHADPVATTGPDAFPEDFPNDFDVGEAIAPRLLGSRRADGWTAERQRAFCDAVATGQTIEGAAREVGLSATSAYAFRNSAKGAAFGIGWMAAAMIQRQRLADVLAARAFTGQTVTVTRASGHRRRRSSKAGPSRNRRWPGRRGNSRVRRRGIYFRVGLGAHAFAV